MSGIPRWQSRMREQRRSGETRYHMDRRYTCYRRKLQSELALCVWIPHFALRCEQHRQPNSARRPTALLAPQDPRRLWQISPSARHAGVKSTMTVSQAVGLCPSLTLWEPDPVHYDERFSSLLSALGNVSPIVEPAELGRAFVGVDGLEGLHGSPQEQISAIERAMMENENTKRATEPALAARFGWARGKFAAWVAATRAKLGQGLIIADSDRSEFLGSQPVAVLQTEPDTHKRLLQLGIKTLSDLCRLPEVAVVSQFGKEGRRMWALVAGKVIDPVTGMEKPEPIVVEFHFPNPVADRTMLTHALERLIECALRHPRRIGWRVLEVMVRAQQETGTSWTTHTTLKNPSADRDHIAASLKSRIEQIPATGAVQTLALEFTTFVRGSNELQLFTRDANSSARAERQQALQTAIHEIRTRFKHTGLYHVVAIQPQSRILERRYALIDYEA
jgi:nucleotidyltransferase/DNA polymerase involved in DNA repair